jgi:hypothetical protein
LSKNDRFAKTGSGQTKGKLKKTDVSLGLWPPHPYPDEQLASCLPVRNAVHNLNPALVELDTIEAAQASLSEAEDRLESATDEADTKLQTALVEQARRNLRKVKDWRSGAVQISVYVHN